MTDRLMTRAMPDIVETVAFLRRFSGMMSIGQNATNLRDAAIIIETLTARGIAAEDEKDHWRHEHAMASNQVDILEAERDALAHEIDGHLTMISSTLAERDAFKAELKALEDERAKLSLAFDRERDALKAKIEALEDKRAELRRAFDRIGVPRNQAMEDRPDEDPLKANLTEADPASAGKTQVIAPEATLRYARAQFECLADEFMVLGDIVSQVMCKVGASSMDRALIAAALETDRGEMAESILAQTSGSAFLAITDAI